MLSFRSSAKGIGSWCVVDMGPPVSFSSFPRASKKSSKPPEPSAPTEATERKPPTSQPPAEQMNGSRRLVAAGGPAGRAPPAASASEQPDSESDSEGPVATQMLSFVMDDPDFESEESESQRKRAVSSCLGS